MPMQRRRPARSVAAEASAPCERALAAWPAHRVVQAHARLAISRLAAAQQQ
jgi:hypothetical protein